jgi:hypothetical protein
MEDDNMREHTTTLYKFEELTKDAKIKAIENWRDSMDWTIESEYISENFEYRLKELGYPTDDLEWRLSYSQGDGVAFYGYIDMNVVARRLLDGDSLSLYNLIVDENLTISAEIYRNSFGTYYSHWNTMEVGLDGDDVDTMMEYLYEEVDRDSDEYVDRYSQICNLLEELDNRISDDIKSVSKELEKDGYSEIEYHESDNAISEALIANEYEFTSEGKISY